MSEPNSALLLARHQAGENDAATPLFDRYAAKLRVVVRRRLSSSMRRRFDSEDVVQSTFRSFFGQAETRDYSLEKPGDLWRLLAAIALNKLRARVNAERASKRDVRQERHVDAEVDGVQAAGLITSDEPRPEEVVAASEILLRTMRSLDALSLQVFAKVFQGHSNAEIAASLGVSERTVRRTNQQIRQRMTDDLLSRAPSRRGASSITAAPDGETPDYLSFSDYILLNMVGRGGMGKVYRARSKSTDQLVAVKTLLKSRQQDPVALGRFVHEGRLLKRLKHPNIVGLHGIGRYPHGGYFLVLDFVDGEDLAARLERGPLPQDEAVRIVAAVAQAVQHAHDRGVLHLDLKPANVLLARDGRVFVTDFGFGDLLRPSEGNAASTDGGTLAYMAPEQLDRSLGPVGPASDVFGLGGLLFSTLTANPPPALPRQNDSHGTLEWTRFEAKPNSARTSESRLIQICDTCLATSPRERFQSAIDLAQLLQEWNRSRSP